MKQSDCSTSKVSECTPVTCHWRCAVEVIDELLCQRGAATGEETDLLLELRWKLRHREEPEGALRLFCDLRIRMEGRHYLSFFRIRRWLEHNLIADVRICPAAESHEILVQLDHYCVEAVRRVCLCAALGRGAVMIAPRLRFEYRKPASVETVREFAAVVS
ncbi:MAG TPA: hypothetical protein VGO11_02695 [Chthoniobacteraceae bacterium]|nr:hypothetical protein [Chthoniobacteraceae bacterium]